MLDLYEMNCMDMLDLWLPDQSVQTCVTSPPYFRLRDYVHPDQIGLEKTPDEYVAKLVDVFRRVRRVLRDDGTLWLNLGDSYCSTAPGTKNAPQLKGSTVNAEQWANARPATPPGLKPKDLIGIPWRVAFALQADGWYLRQDIIWQKPNPMPESVTDRCTKAHEYVFMLTKNQRYYFDHEAIKEPAVGKTLHDLTGPGYKAPGQVAHTGSRSKRDSFKRDSSKRAEVIPGQPVGTHRPDREESAYDVATRNKRSVWTIATRPFKGAHFATFPPALVEPCILAGSRPGDLVLDPFGGSGTTAGVAMALERRAILCELNPEYAALVPSRVAAIAASLAKTPRADRAVANSPSAA